MPDRLVVIGGDAAGMSAAAQARRRRDERELEIVAFERGDYTSYAACGLPYFVADLVPDAQRLVARSPERPYFLPRFRHGRTKIRRAPVV